MTYDDQAGERWSNTFTKDTTSNYFVLDTYVFLPNPSEVKNLELDINQVTANGETIILSTQCSGEIGQWEYGDSVGKHDHWKSSGIKCNPAEWKANVWHHIQIGEHRDGTNGFVTHDYVILDGVQSISRMRRLNLRTSWAGGRATLIPNSRSREQARAADRSRLISTTLRFTAGPSNSCASPGLSPGRWPPLRAAIVVCTREWPRHT